MLTPEAQAMIEQRKREQAERWDGSRALFDTAYTKGDFRLAEPGAEVWSRTTGDIGNVRMNADCEARGGIILEITANPDWETGELRRSFRCIDYTDTRYPTITLSEEQCDPQSFSAPNWTRIRRTYRFLCMDVGKKLAGNHIASLSEIDRVVDAARLASILGRTLTR